MNDQRPEETRDAAALVIETDRLISRAAHWIAVVGRVNVILSFFVAGLLYFHRHLSVVIVGLVLLITGILMLNTAASFRKVRSDDPQSPQHLLQAIRELGSLFRWIAILISLESLLIILVWLLDRQ